MKKTKQNLLIFIIISSLLIFYLNNTFAATIQVWTDLSALTDDCVWNTCYVWSWTTAIMKLLWWIVKYATFIVWLAAVLFIVINWIMYSMWGMDQSMKEESKKRIVKTLIWIIILLMSWTILNLIAPWIYK